MCKKIFYHRGSLSLSNTIGFSGAQSGDPPTGTEHGLLSVALKHLSCGRISLVFGRESIFREESHQLAVAKRSVIGGPIFFFFFLRDLRRHIF